MTIGADASVALAGRSLEDRRAPAKIALFATQSGVGGLRELWTNLAEGFGARGHDVGVAALYASPADPDDLAPAPWQHIARRRPAEPLGFIRMIRQLRRWLRNERPDVIITALPVANVLVPLVARVCHPRAKVIVTHHSPVDTHHPLVNLADGLVGRLSNVHAVVSVSDAVAASLGRKAAVYRAKRRTIRNALPPNIQRFIEGLADMHRPRTPRGRKLVATGRLAEQKNYPMLLRALALVPGVELDIVGSGPDEAALRALAVELGLGGRVRFLGQKRREEALTLLAGADLFVQVSLFEGHSLALLEAAALGLPLIVSDVPVQIEAITSADGDLCGMIVELGDDASLAAAVGALLDDPAAYRDWSARAGRLSQEATFDAMVARYEALIGESGRGEGSLALPHRSKAIKGDQRHDVARRATAQQRDAR